MTKLPRKFLTILTHISLWVIFLVLPIIFESFWSNPMPEKLMGLPPENIRRIVGAVLNFALICLFYLNFSLLLPRFYLNGQTRLYFLFTFLVFCTFQFVGFLLRNYVFIHFAELSDHEVISQVSIAVSTLFFILVWGASSGFRLAEEWRRTENSRRETESRRLEAELNLLKSQINPHFLLNSLNNLYALALTAPEKTPSALLKLSEMVAYILYECDKPNIALDRDLHFVRNYIELQKMRLPPNVVLHFDLPENAPLLDIEPMILIPFIENAFKHGLTTKQPCDIIISIKIVRNQLVLKVENDVFPIKNIQKGNISGIGLANTRQRLEYSYPEKHTLIIEKSDKKHRVELNVELNPSKNDPHCT